MNSGSEDATIQSLVAELLDELGSSREVLVRYEILFGILWNLFRLFIGIFSIINTVFSFVDGINPTLKQIFLIINLVAASGLLGNFDGRAVKADAGKQNLDIIKKTMLVWQSRLGPRLIHQPMIIDVLSEGYPLPIPHQRMSLPLVINDSLILSDLVENENIKTGIIKILARMP